jgi:hypothetical protein
MGDLVVGDVVEEEGLEGERGGVSGVEGLRSVSFVVVVSGIVGLAFSMSRESAIMTPQARNLGPRLAMPWTLSAAMKVPLALMIA